MDDPAQWMPTSPAQSTSSNSSQSPITGSPGPFTASAPTWSHLDMVRPPTEDPEYKRSLINTASHPINIPGQHPQMFIFGRSSPGQQSPFSSHGRGTMSLPLNLSSPKASKQMRLNGHHANNKQAARSLLLSPNGKAAGPRVGRQRGEARKCRKVYGMDARDSWCTQCKWKKACTRFND